MSTLNKITLINALIASKRAIVNGPDLKTANHAKAALIGLYSAKNHLQRMVELESMRMNIFKKVIGF